MTIKGTLFNDIEIEKVIEVAINLDDIGVVKKKLYFDLSDELFKHFALFNLFFGHYLNGIDELCCFFNS